MKILHSGLMVGNGTSGLSKALVDTFEDVLEVPLNYPEWNKYIIYAAEAFKPDIIFLQIQRPDFILVETAKKLSTISKIINWTGDVRQPIPDWFYSISEYVTTCFSNEHDVNVFKEKGLLSEFIQIGIDENIYHSNYEKLSHVPDIVFMANNYKGAFPLSQERVELVNVMKQKFGNNFKVYGNGWDDNSSLMHSQSLEAQHYVSCKIAINHNHFDLDRFTSDRMFRILASGAFCLSHNYKGIEKDFLNTTHLITYNNIDELITNCEYYLINEGERNRIRLQGQHYCLNNYTFKHMAERIKQCV